MAAIGRGTEPTQAGSIRSRYPPRPTTAATAGPRCLVFSFASCAARCAASVRTDVIIPEVFRFRQRFL